VQRRLERPLDRASRADLLVLGHEMGALGSERLSVISGRPSFSPRPCGVDYRARISCPRPTAISRLPAAEVRHQARAAGRSGCCAPRAPGRSGAPFPPPGNRARVSWQTCGRLRRGKSDPSHVVGSQDGPWEALKAWVRGSEAVDARQSGERHLWIDRAALMEAPGRSPVQLVRLRSGPALYHP
jgi:hypothetical protein